MPEITKDAIDYFIEYAGLDENGVQVGPMKGGIVIFAAGNEERDYRSYPACYERVLSVSALAPDYRKKLLLELFGVDRRGRSGRFLQVRGALRR